METYKVTYYDAGIKYILINATGWGVIMTNIAHKVDLSTIVSIEKVPQHMGV